MRHDIPLIEFEALDPRLQEQLRARVARLGYLGEFFRIFAHQPDSLLAFNDLTAALKDALPDRLTEVVALTVATRSGNHYERNQHIRLCRKLGFPDEWIEAVMALSPDAGATLEPSEVAAQRLVLSAMVSFGQGALPEFRALAASVGHHQAVAVLLLVGRYLCHALAVNTLELEPPVADPLESRAA